MDILSEIYIKNLTENERNLHFWEGYLQNLQSLDFAVYSEKLKIPVLVPIGSRILFRGELKHTNEVTVALGADYFVKCSIKQADVLKQHRIKVAQEKVDVYKKEQEYLQYQMSYKKQHVYENQGQEIIEYHTIEEDKAWREKHQANVKAYIQNRKKEENLDLKGDITDEELWDRLEELELQEEFENELNDTVIDTGSLSLDIVKENIEAGSKENQYVKIDETKAIKEMENMKAHQVNEIPEQHNTQQTKLDLLQKVIDRQNELDKKLHELKNRKRTQSKTEMDILAKLDELEQLDELEDEMERLDDIIENEDHEESEDEISMKSATKSLNRRVSFVDEDDSETLHLTFKHSDVEPNNEAYNPDIGIKKPSDIYNAYSHLFENGTTSILKKSKYDNRNKQVPEISHNKFEKEEITSSVHSEKQHLVQSQKQHLLQSEKQHLVQSQKQHLVQSEKQHPVHQEIIIKDVVEKVQHNNNTLETETKPMSLFKKKRMQNKK